MLIGRKEELRELNDAFKSEYSEFVAVYGRRRVGKTFLVREAFNYEFTLPAHRRREGEDCRSACRFPHFAD